MRVACCCVTVFARTTGEGDVLLRDCFSFSTGEGNTLLRGCFYRYHWQRRRVVVWVFCVYHWRRQELYLPIQLARRRAVAWLLLYGTGTGNALLRDCFCMYLR